jgi:ABC-2 type transport system permease protein
MSAQGVPVSPDAREIRGPSAYGGGWRRFLDLTWMIGSTNYKLTYFGSALGYVWSLMRPLLLFGVLYVVFSQIVRFGGDVKHYPMLLLLNIVLFNFFQEATGRSVTSVVDNEPLVRKMHFPRMVIPLSTVLTAALNLLLSLVAVFVFLLAYGISPRWQWLLLPVILVLLVAFTSAVAMILSSLYVRFRDVQPIWSVLSTALFYATPVLYTIDHVQDVRGEWAEKVVLANPIADLLEQARRWIIDPSAPSAVQAIGGWEWALLPAGVFVAVCAFGLWVYDHEAPRIAERL